MQKKDPSQNNAQLGNLLERYKKIFKPPQASVEKEAVAVIKDICGFELLPHQLVYTVATKTLYVKAPSLVRSELLMQRERIVAELRQRLGDGSAPTTIL